MYGRGGYHVTPEFTEHPDGRIDVDFDVKQGEFRHSNPASAPEDFYEDEQGQMKHVMQDTQLAEPEDAHSFDQEDYFLALQEADPRITDAIDLAPNFFTREQIEDYDRKVNSGNLDDIHSALEYLLKNYEEWEAQSQNQSIQADNEDGDETEPNEQEQVIEWFNDLSDQDIDDAVDELYELEFDDQAVMALQDATEGFAEGSVHADILNAGLMVANGSISMDDAIETITSQHGEASATAAYFQLQQLLN